MSYRKNSYSVYDLKYHLVWITKYRKPVLLGPIGLWLRELVRKTCETLDVYIAKGHIAVESYPSVSLCAANGFGE